MSESQTPGFRWSSNSTTQQDFPKFEPPSHEELHPIIAITKLIYAPSTPITQRLHDLREQHTKPSSSSAPFRTGKQEEVVKTASKNVHSFSSVGTEEYSHQLNSDTLFFKKIGGRKLYRLPTLSKGVGDVGRGGGRETANPVATHPRSEADVMRQRDAKPSQTELPITLECLAEARKAVPAPQNAAKLERSEGRDKKLFVRVDLLGFFPTTIKAKVESDELRNHMEKVQANCAPSNATAYGLRPTARTKSWSQIVNKSNLILPQVLCYSESYGTDYCILTDSVTTLAFHIVRDQERTYVNGVTSHQNTRGWLGLKAVSMSDQGMITVDANNEKANKKFEKRCQRITTCDPDPATFSQIHQNKASSFKDSETTQIGLYLITTVYWTQY
ncbi:hypothetical protein BT69DRAFT_1299588 [Atractiella rhizophila]|nr:hypothetical protein BT69DRAFT_1299588 [Atractiella rhizophila]